MGSTVEAISSDSVFFIIFVRNTINESFFRQSLMEKGNEKAALALDVFCYNVKKYIGAYAAVLNGVDLIIFTGGIGENDNLVRWETCKNMDYLGIQVDKQKNEVRGKDTIISTEQSTTTVMTVTTDEELVIAMDTVRLS